MSRKGKVTPLEGLKLKGGFLVGPQIGQGAQAVVHTLLDAQTRRETNNVVKLTKCPPPKPSGKRKTQQDKEQNSNMLALKSEIIRYTNLFPHGKVVPRIDRSDLTVLSGTTDDGTSCSCFLCLVPLLSIYFLHYSDVKTCLTLCICTILYFLVTTGWKYLIMERMEKTFWAGVDDLMEESPNTKVDLSSLAQQVIHLVHQVHQKKYVLVDIKPDNFMFAKATNTKEKHADLLRIVDLGLWTPVPTQPETVPGLTGNDLYCSLNMQKMNKPTYRDDVQMAVIVIAEMAIRVQAALHNQTDDYKGTKVPAYLPWSQGTNEAEVYRLKEENLLNSKSAFYARMPKNCAETIFNLIQTTQELDFHTLPPYATMIEDLANFAIKVPAKRKTAARSRTGTGSTPRRSVSKKRPSVAASAANHENEEDAKPAARKRRSPRREENRNDRMEIDLTYSTEEEQEDDGGVMPMDIDSEDDEGANNQENTINRPNTPVLTGSKKSVSKSNETQQKLVIKVSQGRKKIDSFCAFPDSLFVFGSGKSNRMKKENTHIQIPAGETVHFTLKVVGLKRPGSNDYHAILKVEIEHTAKTGSTVVGRHTLGPSKKASVLLSQICKGSVSADCKVSVGDVTITFEQD
jgi:serine/threonine protein kinase